MNDDENIRTPAPPSMARLLIQIAAIGIAIVGLVGIVIAAVFAISIYWSLKNGTLAH